MPTKPTRSSGPSMKVRFEAAEAGDLDTVRRVDKRELDVCDRFGQTLLTVASANNYPELVVWLLDAGASPAAHRVEALFLRYLAPLASLAPRGENHTLLHIAAFCDAPLVVELLLARGFAVDARDPYGATPLIDAAMRDCVAVIELLLAAGADVGAHDAFGKIALDHAKKRATVERLLAAGASPDGGPIMEHRTGAETAVPLLERFAGRLDAEIVSLLLANGADPSKAPRALRAAVSAVSAESRLPTLDALLATGPAQASLDEALIAAVHDRALLDRLLSAGAKDLDGALAAAVSAGAPASRSIASRLVELGARARMSPHFPHTALHSAVFAGDQWAFDMAMNADPDLDAVDQDGRTALHHAAHRSHEDFVRALVGRGADVRVEDANGRTPYAFARTNKDSSATYRSILALLVAHGGGPPAPEVEATPPTPSGPVVGDTVTHPKFGRGRVIRVEADKAEVDFEGAGRKVMLSKMLTVEGG